MDLLEVLGALLTAVVFAAMSAAVLWSLFDVMITAPDVSVIQRMAWVFMLVGFTAMAAAAYVTVGPGRLRWDPVRIWLGTRVDRSEA